MNWIARAHRIRPSTLTMMAMPTSPSNRLSDPVSAKQTKETAQAAAMATTEPMVPAKQVETMQFMFETRFPQMLTKWAATEMPLQDDYVDCWQSLEKKFDGTPGTK